VRRGNVLTFPQGPHVRVVRVVALGARRGPAPEARGLYEDLAPPELSAGSETESGRRPKGTGRPTKADRRALERLRDRGPESR
jgi:ribosome-associated heat shock protein Hsp15